jgi:hypothetical protein
VTEDEKGTYPLENGDGEGGGLSGTGLGLSDTVTTSNNGHDSSLLDSRGSLETVGVDTSEEVRLQLHVVEAKDKTLPLLTRRWTYLSVTLSQLDSMRSSLISRPFSLLL